MISIGYINTQIHQNFITIRRKEHHYEKLISSNTIKHIMSQVGKVGVLFSKDKM